MACSRESRHGWPWINGELTRGRLWAYSGVYMAYPPITEHWPEIRKLAEQGVPLPDLAEKYDVPVKAIYNRCGREDWYIPSRVKAKLLAGKTEKRTDPSSDPLLGGASRSEFSDSVLLETWETRAADLRNVSFLKAIKAIRESDVVLETASDLKHAVHVARQATGLLDTDAPQIQLSLFGNGDICGPAIMENDSQPVIDLQQDQELDGFWE